LLSALAASTPAFAIRWNKHQLNLAFMSTIAPTGFVIYALELHTVSRFYARLLLAKITEADAKHQVLAWDDGQLVIHAIPAEFAKGIRIDNPPVPRQEQAIKPWFKVNHLLDARWTTEFCGGKVCGEVWLGPGYKALDVCDPEGNVLQLREHTTDPK
jgi:predicted enzyme related to lactoylglutathione lyase